MALKLALGRRAEKLREQLPDVLTIMASSLRAGHSFLQALDTTAKEIAQPAATEFQRVVAEIRLGRSAEDALGALAERVGSADFKWAVLAVNIQREVGGNLAEILDNVADTLRERATMRRQIRVLTSEGRLSAWVLALMPFAIALYMFAVNQDYIMLLFTTKVGLMMLGRRRHRCSSPGSSGCGRSWTSMSEIWLLLAIGCVFSSVLLVGFALDASSTERKRAVRLLENQVSGSHSVASANLREQELSQSFGNRVLVPFVGGAGRVARRITPLDARDRVAKKLLLAGSPEGWDAERVIAFKVIGAGGRSSGPCCSRS